MCYKYGIKFDKVKIFWYLGVFFSLVLRFGSENFVNVDGVCMYIFLLNCFYFKLIEKYVLL